MRLNPFIIVILVALPVCTWAQVMDDFSDGNFTENPVWTGDTAVFDVNSQKQLHLKGALADTSVLATLNYRAADTEWDFWIKLSFNTSANNYARVYLVSDTSGLVKEPHGYFLRIGGADDSIRFCRQDGTTMVDLLAIHDYATSHSLNILRFRILREPGPGWTIQLDTTGGTNYIPQGSIQDSTYIYTSWAGVFCRYTASNATKFYFDDFYIGPVKHDSIPPGISNIKAEDEHRLAVAFTETPEGTTAMDRQNYHLVRQGQNPDSVRIGEDPARVILYFSQPFVNPYSDTLVTQGIKDPSGNVMPVTKTPFCYYVPLGWDILIHEIMADPIPAVALPDEEFVELYNRANYPVDLENWSIMISSTVKTFPAVTIPPGGYLIVTKGTGYSGFGPMIDLFTSSSTLPNDGSTIVLYNEKHQVIHSVTYSKDWYDDPIKAEGGWSLEMIDPLNPCGCRENWKASQGNMGGTPGWPNSVAAGNPDLQPPVVTRANIKDSLSVQVIFSEAMDSTGPGSNASWEITPGNILCDSVHPEGPDFRVVELYLGQAPGKGIIYEVKTTIDFHDCAGNILPAGSGARFAIPDSASAQDIVINEFLHHPASGGSRYIELYNRSPKVLELAGLEMASFDAGTGAIKDEAVISEGGYQLFPASYVVITPDSTDILGRFVCKDKNVFIQPGSFPSFTSEGGIAGLLRVSDKTVIDKMEYSDELHFPLLNSTEGISLERLNPDRPSGEKGNWHSASQPSGGGTPGYQNSQFSKEDGSDGQFTLSPEIFSPDNDGRDDVLNIHYILDSPGTMMKIVIFDAQGRLVRQLVTDEIAGTEGDITWDGLDDERNRAAVGIYVLYIELINPQGTVSHIIKTTVLGARL